MAITEGQRFVRRHDAARSSTSNTTAADIAYDTAVLSEGGYSWSSPEVTVDTAGKYLFMFDLGQCDLASTRAVGTLVPSINTTDQTRFRAQHRYLRNSGGAQQGTSFGAAILDLSASDDVKVRNPGTGATSTDAVGNYGTNSGSGGGIQMVYLGDGSLTHVERTSDAAEVGTSNINATRPWVDSSGTWTTVTFNSEVSDDDGLYGGTGGDITLAANSKYLVVWGVTAGSTDASRHTYSTRLVINSNNVQAASGYQRNTSSQGPPHCGIYLHETGGSAETLNIQATHETEGGDAGTPNVHDAYVQVYTLPADAEWIHVDNGTTDSLTTALAGTTTWYDTPLSSTFRADGDSNLSLDSGNDAVQNDSGGSLPVLAVGWVRWDRDSGSSGTRKNPWSRWDNGGTGLGYGIAGAFSRGQQSTDDCWQAHYVSGALMDLANGADLSWQHQDEASANNSDMGVYASTSRYFLGVQVLNLDTLASGGSGATVTPAAISMSVVAPAATPDVVASPGGIALAPTIYDDAVVQTHCTVQVDRIWLELHLPDAEAQPPSGAATVEPGVISLSVTVPAATAVGAATVTPSAISLSVVVPAANPDVVAGPSSVDLSVTVPAPTVSAAVTVTPDPVAMSVVVPAATPSAAVTQSPAGTALSVVVPTQQENVGAGPAVTALSVVLPAPTIITEGGVIVEPAAISTSVAVPAVQPNVEAGPSEIVTTVTIPAATPATGVTVTPAAISLSVGVQSASTAIGAGPAAITTAVSLPASTEHIEASPSNLALSVVLPAATPVTEGAAIVTPAAISMSVVVPQVTPSADFVVAPASIDLAATLEAQTENVGAGPDSVDLAVTVPQATPDTAAPTTVTPGVIGLSVGVPAVTVSVGTAAAPTPGVIVLSVTVPSVSTATGTGTTVAPGVLTVVAAVPVSRENVGAGPQVLNLSAVFPTVVVLVPIAGEHFGADVTNTHSGGGVSVTHSGGATSSGHAGSSVSVTHHGADVSQG